jgi:AraC-like DNA-binding protein
MIDDSLDEREVRRGQQLVQLRQMVERRVAEETSTAIEGVRVASVDSDVDHEGPSGIVFALIVQGAKTLGIGNRMYSYQVGEYLVSSVDLPVTGHFVRARPEEPALGFGLDLKPSTIAGLLLEAEPDKPLRPTKVSESEALGVAQADVELLDAVTRMLLLLDRGAEDQRVLAPMIEREIVWHLLQGPLGQTVRQLGISDNSATHVGQAVRWISEHFDETFRVEALAKNCGLSPSSFHRGFRAMTGVSPIQFQKQVRLQRSRFMLIAGGDVTTVGHQVGYDSISQFSREYRRQFGLPPSQDIARMRDQEPHAGGAVETQELAV